MRPNEISYKVIGAGMDVHTAMGPSLVESAYDGVQISPGYRVDFMVEYCVIVEIKCVEKVLALHEARLLSYLKVTGLPLGLLLNFKVTHIRDGITRRINAPEADL